VAGAVLAGDLCLSWCDEMYAGSALPAEVLGRGRKVFDRMRTELMCGQYLDMLEQVRATTSVQQARHVIRYKSANYTVAQPLLLGGALGGAPAPLLAAYDDYGLALGEAFQLRDDVLGVFGDPAATGKPAGDDLREGKRTVLISLTLERADSRQAALVRRHLGDPHLSAEGVSALREVIEETGALAHSELLIDERVERSLAALAVADLDAEAREVLRELAAAATDRRR
jgi:geranylgeranyl diphosphate synthase type I